MKVNGSNVTDTLTLVAVKNADELVLSTEFLLSLSATNQVQVWGLTSTGTVGVHVISAGGTPPNDYPRGPGIIVNMYRIA